MIIIMQAARKWHLGLKKGGILFPVELSVNSWLKDDKYYFCAFVKDITQLLKEEKNSHPKKQGEKRPRRSGL